MYTEQETNLLQVSKINHMNEYESDFENLHASFVTSLSIYRNSCEELLSSLMLSDNEIFELLQNRGSKSWEDDKLARSLRDRLGPDYKLYKESVEQLDRKIMLFGEKLNLGDDMMVNL